MAGEAHGAGGTDDAGGEGEIAEERYKDGSLKARGRRLADGTLVGAWAWWRNDGTRLRSGSFDGGEQVGEWITYNRDGEPHKITDKGPKA